MFIAFKFHAFAWPTKFDNKIFTQNFIHELIKVCSSTIVPTCMYISISIPLFAEQLMHKMPKVMQNFLSQEHLKNVLWNWKDGTSVKKEN